MSDYTANLIGLADPDSEVFEVESVQNLQLVHIRKKCNSMFCTVCSTRMRSKGWRTQNVNHPVLQGGLKLELVLHKRKWHCPQCGTYAYDDFVFVQKGKQNTNLVPYMIVNEMRDLMLTVRSVARRFNVSDTYVHDQFLSLVKMDRLPLSDTIAVDEVYLHCDHYDNYALVIMDFRTFDIIDILPNRKQETMEYYFKYVLPKEERDKVKYLICDMYDPYLNFVGKYFKNAVSIVDSFHVVQKIIMKLRYYINDVKKRYQKENDEKLEKENFENNRSNKTKKDSPELYILKHFYWALLKNYDDIEHSWDKHYNRFLQMSLDSYDCEKLFLDLDPHFRKMRDLKEKYIRFNRAHQGQPEKAREDLDELIHTYETCEFYQFREIADLLKRHREQIINSFTYITVTSRKNGEISLKRLSNGPLESFNNVPKDYKRITNGVANFEFTRNRILWSVRKDAHPLGVPRKVIRAEVPDDQKRGPYKKKQK